MSIKHLELLAIRIKVSLPRKGPLVLSDCYTKNYKRRGRDSTLRISPNFMTPSRLRLNSCLSIC
jgi:hypothetical protein